MLFEHYLNSGNFYFYIEYFCDFSLRKLFIEILMISYTRHSDSTKRVACINAFPVFVASINILLLLFISQ